MRQGCAAIKDTCEQYWNEPLIATTEVHTILGFIHQQARLVETQFAQAQRERDDWKCRYDEEYAIVDRIWQQLGMRTFAQTKGRSIYDLIEVLQTQVQQAQAALFAIRQAVPFGRAWALEHQRDDHMVTLDHKDEIDLAEFVLAVHTALQAGSGG